MADMVKKRLPVGIENFEEIRTDDYYYVDKTEMIKELLLRRGKVNLFTRSRRFGKSLNMSMLKYFLETGCDKKLFDGLAIMQETVLCQKYMGKFPVIAVSLKGVEAGNFDVARSLAIKVINEEARRLYFLLDSPRLSRADTRLFSLLLDENMTDSTLYCSLRELSELLRKHYGEKVIILIDEYDVPLAKANENGYYDQMIHLIRNLFEQALKTNDSLYFAVLTGCLRVSKESIFTGLNNPSIFSITDEDCDSCFGFTDTEVRNMLTYYDLEDKYETIREWYDGYCFGDADIYCPWDVVNYVNKLLVKRTLPPQDYWSNTSSNEIVHRFVEKLGKGLTKSEIEALVAGETVTKEIQEDLTYNRIYDSIENIWSVLFTTGYLTQRGTSDGRSYRLAIPNMEIRNIFKNQIMNQFRENVAKDGETLGKFCDALQTGNAAEVERLFTQYLEKTISIRDTFVKRATKENFYHGILLGILGFKGDWFVKSNQESGDGYSDIMIKIEDKNIGIVIEVKYAENAEYASACRSALEQITEKGYAKEFEEDGSCVIYLYGIACYKKKCMVMAKKENF